MVGKKSASRILKEARLKQGLTQIEVAEKAGIHANTYAKIERGLNNPSPSSIKKLIRVLELKPSDIESLL